jgi:hypothetical protein
VRALLDVNVLIALLDAAHIGHVQAAAVNGAVPSHLVVLAG